MMEFVTIVAAVVVGMSIYALLSIAITTNERVMTWLTDRIMKVTDKVIDNLSDN